jgi:hypothetical protein
MLDGNNGRFGEFLEQGDGRIGIGNVVVRQFLATQLLSFVRGSRLGLGLRD